MLKDFGQQRLATFHSPFCMANFAKGTPDQNSEGLDVQGLVHGWTGEILEKG